MTFSFKVQGKVLFNSKKLEGLDFLEKVQKWYPRIKYKNISLNLLPLQKKIFRINNSVNDQFILIELENQDVLRCKEAFKHKKQCIFDIDVAEIANKFLKFKSLKIEDGGEEFKILINVFLDEDKLKEHLIERLTSKKKLNYFPRMQE